MIRDILVKTIELKSHLELRHTIRGAAERVYVDDGYPELLRLANDYRFAANTGDHVHDKIYGELFDKKKEEAEKTLRAAGVSASRQQRLEDLVYLGNFEYSRGVYGVQDSRGLYLQNFKKIILRPKQKTA